MSSSSSSSSRAKMQAIVYTQYGGPEVTELQEMKQPVPGPREVKIRVVAGGLNPVDWHQRAGDMKSIYSWTFPKVAGNELSGIIDEVGQDVSTFKKGDRVVCRVTKSELGAFGEYIAISASLVAKAPTSISLTDAAGLPLSGLTALQGLDLLSVKAGDRVLITAGAGAVGQFAIQLAKTRGAHVTTTASEAGRSYVEQAGADEVVDYHNQKISDLPTKFLKVLDLAGGEAALINDVIPAVEKGGRILSVAGPLTPGVFDSANLGWKSYIVNFFLYLRSRAVRNAAYARGVDYKYFFMRPDGAELASLCRLVDDGKLYVSIDSHYELQDFKKAFERLESGRAKGKLIIEFSDAN